MNTKDGFILVDKPEGITSFDVIRKLRKILKIKKMGHMGTLDPLASGLLPICVGRSTRLSQFVIKNDKCYLAGIRLGRTTDSYDAEGEFTSPELPVPHLDHAGLDAALDQFRGTFLQYPPVFSAKKVNGKKLYEYAREGKEVEVKPSEITIHSINIVSAEDKDITLDIHCSSGTYIRSLAHDLGKALGCGAYLTSLRRTLVGDHKIENSFTLDQIEAMRQKEDFSFLAGMQKLVPHFPSVKANKSQVKRIMNGNEIVVHNPLLKNDEHVCLLDPQGSVIAIGVVRRPLGMWQTFINPKIVFN